MRRLAIAGATGSIGRQALSILPTVGDLEPVLLGCGKDRAALSQLGPAVGCDHLIVEGDSQRSDAFAAALGEAEPDVVLNAASGFAGLAITRAAIDCGADVALANKESLVAGGSLVIDAAATRGIELIPVDSEHAALAQLLAGSTIDSVEGITITASGGPFRGWSRSDQEGIEPDQALRHPTWKMGGKITIDSATLFNKALEVIEAHVLFGLSSSQIDVLVHPQSIVHGLVRFRDGVQLAHLGVPDMRAPIAWALSGRGRPALDIDRLDLAAVGRLDFEAPDHSAFPALELAFRSLEMGGAVPAVLNAANEAAVAAFVEGRLTFPGISRVVAAVIDACGPLPLDSWEDCLAADRAAREAAEREIVAVS